MSDKEKNFISATVYLYNAADELETFITMLSNVFKTHFENSEIIFINDNSTDNSSDIVREVSKRVNGTSISLLEMGYYQGREVAMNAGRDLTIGDFVFEFDSVFVDYSEEEIMRVYYQALEGYDVVSANPDQNTRITSKLFYRLFDKFSDINYKLSSERFRIISRRIINRAMSMNYKIPYRKVIYSCCGLPMMHLTYSVKSAEPVISELIGKKERHYRRNLGIDVMLLFTGLGYRFSITMTFIMIMMMLAVIVYSFIVYMFGNPVEGWTTTILFFSFAFFGLFGLLTIIIKYLQIILDLVFKRKQYCIENLEKLTR